MGRGRDVLDAMTVASTEGRWTDVGACVTDDVRAWSPAYEIEGRAAWVETIRAQNEQFDDIRVEYNVLAEDDSKVISEWEWSIPHPSGVGRFVLRGMSVYELRGDLIAHLRQYWDTAIPEEPELAP